VSNFRVATNFITLMDVAQPERAESLPHHSTVLECPNDPDRRTAIDQRIADAHITPVGYPERDHEVVVEIPGLLLG
jgi:hypothetical protein